MRNTRLPAKSKIVKVRVLSELEEFASAFHQDFTFDCADFDAGVRRHLDSLSQQRLSVLRSEFSAFFNALSGEGSARSSWKKAGAEWIPNRLKLLDKFQKIQYLIDEKVK